MCSSFAVMTDEEYLQKIIPYFPYKLKFKAKEEGMYWGYPNHKDQGFVFIFNLITTPKRLFHYKKGISWIGQLRYDSKPILKPLSYLTKEIEHNGEKFIPLQSLKNWLVLNQYNDKHTKLYLIENSPLRAPYWMVQKLHEWHFDTEGLIEAGLAIDINTL